MAATSDIKDLALLYYMEDLLRQKKSIKRVKEQVSKYNDTKLKLKLGAYKFGRMWSIAINRAVVQRDTQRRV
jgi:flagellar biosynthesis/type III secretory pathway ATPase